MVTADYSNDGGGDGSGDGGGIFFFIWGGDAGGCDMVVVMMEVVGITFY